jgi:hypothetical protein
MPFYRPPREVSSKKLKLLDFRETFTRQKLHRQRIILKAALQRRRVFFFAKMNEIW